MANQTKKTSLWRDPFWADKFPKEVWDKVQPICDCFPTETQVEDKIAEYRKYYKETYGETLNVALGQLQEFYQWMVEETANKLVEKGAKFPVFSSKSSSNFIMVHEPDVLETSGKTIYWPRLVNVEEIESISANGTIYFYSGDQVTAGETIEELAELLGANKIEGWKSE